LGPPGKVHLDEPRSSTFYIKRLHFISIPLPLAAMGASATWWELSYVSYCYTRTCVVKRCGPLFEDARRLKIFPHMVISWEQPFYNIKRSIHQFTQKQVRQCSQKRSYSTQISFDRSGNRSGSGHFPANFVDAHSTARPVTNCSYWPAGALSTAGCERIYPESNRKARRG